MNNRLNYQRSYLLLLLETKSHLITRLVEITSLTNKYTQTYYSTVTTLRSAPPGMVTGLSPLVVVVIYMFYIPFLLGRNVIIAKYTIDSSQGLV